MCHVDRGVCLWVRVRVCEEGAGTDGVHVKVGHAAGGVPSLGHRSPPGRPGQCPEVRFWTCSFSTHCVCRTRVRSGHRCPHSDRRNPFQTWYLPASPTLLQILLWVRRSPWLLSTAPSACKTKTPQRKSGGDSVKLPPLT